MRILLKPYSHVVVAIHATGIINLSCQFRTGENSLALVDRHTTFRVKRILFPPLESRIRNPISVTEVLHSEWILRDRYDGFADFSNRPSFPVTNKMASSRVELGIFLRFPHRIDVKKLRLII
jgi:hypothetical protein